MNDNLIAGVCRRNGVFNSGIRLPRSNLQRFAVDCRGKQNNQ